MATPSIDANLLAPASPALGIASATQAVQLSSNTASGPSYPTQALSALETYKKKDSSKVVVRFKAIGNAPIMKNNYFRITSFNRFQAVIQFLRKELGWKQGDALFLYINSSFSPAPDDSVGNLFRVSMEDRVKIWQFQNSDKDLIQCFGTEGHLIVNYSTQAAWG